MGCTYVFAATETEARPVRKIVADSEIVVITSGMGPKNAKQEAEARLRQGVSARKPDAVLVIGLCGGLISALPEGQIVTYTQCLSFDSPESRFCCSESILNSTATALKSSGIPCERVVGITSPHIATSRNQRLALAETGAAVVDMESHAIVSVAAQIGIPAGVIRVVSDSVDRELPDFNRALDKDGGLDGRKALRVVLTSPLRTARLLAANRRAMQHLEQALQIVLRNGLFAKQAAV